MEEKTPLELLKEGLFMKEIDTQSNEPHHYVLDLISPTVMLSSWRSEYAGEMKRVLSELRITIELIKGIAITEANAKELLLYYQGIYLHLTHQMKGKLFGLIRLIIEEDEQHEPIKDDDIKLKKLLEQNDKLLNKIGITDQLKEWDHGTSRPIGITLDRRTNYHHRRSALHLNEALQNFDFSRIMLKQEGVKLTDERIEEFQKMEKDSFTKWKADMIEKTSNTLIAIEENINQIAEKLISYFDIPIANEKKVDIINKHQKMYDSFKIENDTLVENLPKKLIEGINKIINESKLKEYIETVYIVGSLPRGDFNPVWSDFNMYMILKDDAVESKTIVADKLNEIPELKLEIFSVSDFKNDSQKSRKARFICWADGLVIYGNDLIGKEDFPKAGMDLAILLNYDLYEDIESYEEWVRQNQGYTEKAIGKKSKEIAKRIVDFIYGIAITNKPSYTSNRIERIKHIDKCFPDNKNSIYIYLDLLSATIGVKTMEEIGFLIDELKRNAPKLDRIIEERRIIDSKKKG
jgi:predicted nucleotidyltransferase